MTTDHCTCLCHIQEPPKPLSIRKASVNSAYYNALKPKHIGHYRCGRFVPWINLRGFWLQNAGFEVGKPYEIEVFENKLVLTLSDCS